MKALVHLALLSLLFVTSAVQGSTASSTVITTITTTTTPTPPTTIPTTASTLATTTLTPTTSPTTTLTPTTSPTTTLTPTTSPTTTLTPTTSPTTTLTPTTSPTTTLTPTTSPTTTLTPTTSATTTLTPTTSATTTLTPTTSPTTTLTPTTSATTTLTPTTSPTTTLTPTTSPTTTLTPTTSPTINTTSVSVNSSSTDQAPTTNGSTVAPVTQNNSSETSGSVTSPTSTSNPGSTVPRNPCQGGPCKDTSSCVSLYNTYFCLCSFGYYYNSSTCTKGKLFPGNITVKFSEISGLGDENSLAYQELHNQITKFFENVFRNSDYGQTVINRVSISPSARSETRAGNSDVVVEVVNIFAETTKQNETTVSKSITEAIGNNITGYSPQNLCDYYGCEKQNEDDNCDNGLLCKCKPGMERPNAQIPVCVASAPKCPDACNAEHNKQCLVDKTSGNPKCVCLPGYKEGDGEICQACAFGYSGVDCEDQFQLILTIVGTIGGALIICLVIGLIVLARSKNKNKNIEEENLIENDFQNLRLKQTTTGFSNLGADGSIFPKVRANVSRQPQNPYVSERNMPRPDY